MEKKEIWSNKQRVLHEAACTPVPELGTKFGILIDRNPKEALKYVKNFKDTVFWNHFSFHLETMIKDSLGHLYSCDPARIERIRGEIDGYTKTLYYPDKIIGQLKDQIALDEEAAKVEEARQEGNKK
ncbi:MAG: hypothetical protein ACYS6K_26285 [Planctomycetota bacterium]|jgi:hypothetical protein